MLFKLLIVLSFASLPAKTKECQAGQNCEFRCCVTPGSQNVLCRERCLGLSCELDAHCDGDCCVNSTCSSCLLKRLTPSSLAGSVEETDISKTTASDLKETEIPSSKNNVCSKFNDCPSECCIDGQCVESSRCKPVFAARGGRGGGGRSGGRSRGRGGGYSGGTSSGSGGSLPVWGIILIVFGSILVAFSPFIIAWICSSCS